MHGNAPVRLARFRGRPRAGDPLVRAENVPAHIALVLDTSESVRSSRGSITNMAMKLAGFLQPQDRFSVVTFNDETRIRMDWGNRSDTIGPVLGSFHCNGRPRVWGTLWLVGNKVFRGVEGRKAAIIYGKIVTIRHHRRRGRRRTLESYIRT